MASSSSYEPQGLRLSATFCPGGSDDFTMPELISPSPQRIMPEVPSNMQRGLAQLELEAREIQVRDREGLIKDQSTEADVMELEVRAPRLLSGAQGSAPNYAHTNASVYANVPASPTNSSHRFMSFSESYVDPFKPFLFPKPRDAGPSVPPSHEEQESILERARTIVLNSNDPEMQLAWAQDALVWVDIAAGSRARCSGELTLRSATPKAEHHLRVDAISIVDFLADQSHPKALFLKATWHEFGKFGSIFDRKEAFNGYRKAAEKGYARAEYRMGTQYESMQDMAKSIRHYNIGVKLSDSASNYRMGMMSLLGQHDQPQDFGLAVQRIRFAAETADENAPQGAYIYGMLLARELPNITVPDAVLPADMELAKKFIEKSAYLGFAKAQTKMGSAYELCLLGCDFDPALSLHYNALAARQGDAEAEMAISKWFLCGHEGIFERNEELAFTFAKRAADTGLATAEFALGYFYEIGMYVQLDLRKAKAWYEKAAGHGNSDAEGRLESISHHQVLSKKDHEEIAITRIKSQHGSRRGGRPERLKEKSRPLPAMAEEAAELPSPGTAIYRPSSSASFKVTPPENYPSTRPKSTAPYPNDDVALPAGYRHPRTAPLQVFTGPRADRPRSAFGIRPVHPDQQAETSSPSYGNRTPVDGKSANAGGRIRIVSAGSPPRASGYRSPPSNPDPSMHPMDPNRQQPLETSQGGRNRLQKAAPNLTKPQSPGAQLGAPYPMDSFGAVPAPGSQGRHHSLPQNAASHSPIVSPALSPQPLDYRPGYGQRMGGQRPTSNYDLTESASGNTRTELYDAPQRRAVPPPRTSSIHPPRTGSVAPLTSQTNSVPPTPVAPAKPIKEGPKTFDDMGIPQHKNESECLVM